MLRKLRQIFRRSSGNAPAVTTPRSGGISVLPSITRDALNVATVYRCVNLLADAVANLPIQYMRLKGDIFVEDRSNRLHYLLNVQPCSYMSGVDFWRQAVQYLLLRGNAYIVPVYDHATLELLQLSLVDPTCVAHDTLTDTYVINDINAGVRGTYAEEDIIHIKNYTRDGKNGISTLAFARTTMDIALTGDGETLNRFANGGNVRGVISNDNSVRGFGEYQDDELKKTATN
jgi:HK97 family phage portal protein